MRLSEKENQTFLCILVQAVKTWLLQLLASQCNQASPDDPECMQQHVWFSSDLTSSNSIPHIIIKGWVTDFWLLLFKIDNKFALICPQMSSLFQSL